MLRLKIRHTGRALSNAFHEAEPYLTQHFRTSCTKEHTAVTSGQSYRSNLFLRARVLYLLPGKPFVFIFISISCLIKLPVDLRRHSLFVFLFCHVCVLLLLLFIFPFGDFHLSRRCAETEFVAWPDSWRTWRARRRLSTGFTPWQGPSFRW